MFEAGSLELFSHDWELLRAKGNPQSVYDDLRARYQDPGRFYHTWEEHIAPGETDFEPLLSLFPTILQAGMRMAWRFHDSVQVLQRPDSENVLASMLLLKMQLGNAGVRIDIVSGLGKVVMGTDHSKPVETLMQRFIRDVDLAILGKDHKTFERYDKGIEQEYDWVQPKSKYIDGRIAVLEMFKNQGTKIYGLSQYKDMYGLTALANLDYAINRLKEQKG